MTDPQPDALSGIRPDFDLHPEIGRELAAGFDVMLVAGTNTRRPLFRDRHLTVLHQDESEVVVAAHVDMGDHLYVRFRGRLLSGQSKAQFWALPVYGGTGMSGPLIGTQDLSWGLQVGEAEIGVTRLDAAGTHSLNGQGRAIQSLIYDFATGEVEAQHGLNEPNDYVPRDGTQTGGNWSYMGVRFPSVDPKLLYTMGCYGGHFFHPDGRVVTDQDYPKAVLHNGMHFSRFAPAWIHYTHPHTPWADRSRDRWVNWDGQHFCVDAMCQEFLRSRDQGLAMLIESFAGTYTMQFPDVPRGTTHHKPGAARSQGRLLKGGCNLYLALREMPWAADLRENLGAQVYGRWLNQAEAWRRHFDWPWPYFGHSHDGDRRYSPGEIGIQWWGLDTLHRVVSGYGVDLVELQYMKAAISERVFNDFQKFGGDTYKVPYWVDQGGDDSGPSSGAIFAIQAALDHETSDLAKMAELQTLADAMDPRHTQPIDLTLPPVLLPGDVVA